MSRVKALAAKPENCTWKPARQNPRRSTSNGVQRAAPPARCHHHANESPPRLGPRRPGRAVAGRGLCLRPADRAPQPGRVPEQLPGVRAQELRRTSRVAHSGVTRRPAATPRVTHADPPAGLRFHQRQRDGEGGHAAGCDLDRPRDGAGPDRRHQCAHRPSLLAARVAGVLPGSEARDRSGHRAVSAAAHRCGADLAQPLRPPRRCERARPERATRRAAAFHRAARVEGLVRRARDRLRGRTRLVAIAHPGRARRAGRTGAYARAALVRSRPDRSHADLEGRLRGVRARPASFLHRRHRLFEGLQRHP